jgi:ATP-binding cassette, subfamily B, bacterial
MLVKISFSHYHTLFKTYLAPQKWPVLVLGLLIFGNLGLQLLIPQIMRAFIDSVIAGVSLTFLARLGALFLVTALVQQGIAIISTYYTQNIGWRATNALREDLARHALNLDMRFHKTHPAGEMISRIDSDITTLNDFFSQFLLKLVGNGFLVIAILVILYFEDWRIGLVLTIFAIAALFVLTRFRNIAVPHWEAERKAEADFFSFLEERLGGTVDIRANGGRPYTLRQFFVRIQVMFQRSIKAGLMVNYMLNTMFFLFALGNAISLGVGGSLYLNGVISIGTVYIIYQYNRMLEYPLDDISRQLSNVQKSLASIKRIYELFETKGEISVPLDAPVDILIPEGTPLAVQFDHVSFYYDDEDPSKTPHRLTAKDQAPDTVHHPVENVLEDISFSLESGDVLGLLGRTGSGKTTLTRLLFRLYDPQTGQIKINPANQPQGLVDIQEIPLPVLRSRIGMVTQNIELFHASVRDNLTFFDLSIPDDQILAVLHELGLQRWFAGLKDGLDTLLESGGSGLSAGEAQLLAFTRIFLHDPGLVVLDEASSRLDPATEHLVEKAVEKLTAHRTALIIAHRLKTLEHADKIMVLDKGRVIEFGNRLTLALDPSSRFNNLLLKGMDEVLA